jgi:hypothetical protein
MPHGDQTSNFGYGNYKNHYKFLSQKKITHLLGVIFIDIVDYGSLGLQEGPKFKPSGVQVKFHSTFCQWIWLGGC